MEAYSINFVDLTTQETIKRILDFHISDITSLKEYNTISINGKLYKYVNSCIDIELKRVIVIVKEQSNIYESIYIKKISSTVLEKLYECYPDIQPDVIDKCLNYVNGNMNLSAISTLMQAISCTISEGSGILNSIIMKKEKIEKEYKK